MDKNKIWEIKKKKRIFKTRLFEIFNLDCYLSSKNIKHNFFSIEIFNWVNVFSMTKDNQAILVKQHRLGKDLVTIEVPAGGIDKNEEPKSAAVRELEEETGYTSKNIILLKKISVNPAIQNNTCYFFLALDCEKIKETNFDKTEEIELVFMDKEELFNSMDTDMMDNSLSYMSVMLAKNYLNKHNV